MSRMPSTATPTGGDGENWRARFTQFLNSPSTHANANWLTRLVVGNMNAQMVRENTPMTRAHYEAGVESIRRGDTICQYLTAENQHVLDSQGTGFVYRSGYVFHRGVRFMNTPVDDPNGIWTMPSS